MVHQEDGILLHAIRINNLPYPLPHGFLTIIVYNIAIDSQVSASSSELLDVFSFTQNADFFKCGMLFPERKVVI